MLGLYDGPSGGAALARDGELLACAEEHRLTRVENACGLPRASVQAVLRQAGIRGDKLAAVLVATRDATYAETAGGAVRVPLLWRVSQALPSPPPLGRRLRASFAAARRRRIDEALRSEFGASCPVAFVDHHLAHAASAALVLDLPDCVAFTADAGADGAWATVTEFKDGVPRRLVAETAGPSITAFLDAVCERVGIPPGLDRARRLEELAGRGVTLHYDDLEAAFGTDDGALSVDAEVLVPGGVLGRVGRKARREDVAASALAAAAHHLRRWVTHWYVRCEAPQLAVAGDLFDMPSLVHALVDAPDLPAPRLPAAPADCGLAVGAALAGCLPGVLAQPMPRPRRAQSSPYLGPSYPDDEIARLLERERVPFRHHPRIERDLARVLAEGRTAARFDERAELGRRALGNRVILRHPQGPLRLGRLGFIHGAGAYDALVLHESLPRLFEDVEDVPDLLDHPRLVMPRADFASRYPDLLAWGRRVRVQSVSAASNPKLFEILTEFQSWTGLPLLAAAPFRLPNEPAVSSPADAVRAFRVLGLDHAAIGRYLVHGADAASGSAVAGEAEENRAQGAENPW